MLRATLVALAVLLAAPATSATPKPRYAGPAPVAARAAPLVEVLWGGQWWRATVLRARKGFKKIHYEGWGAEYDEWVEVARVRRLDPAAAPESGLRRVEILWGGQWWPGVELEVRSGLHKIHYEGWGPEWDQWVELRRLRAPAAAVRPVATRAPAPRRATKLRYGVLH